MWLFLYLNFAVKVQDYPTIKTKRADCNRHKNRQFVSCLARKK
ncbi:hypothetical protein VCRA2121O157_40166 [Vibrio crassostreae]|nr:hypothetical protein VCRA2112O187_1280002 [Vibrio crassostreae]CAK1837708.1 hypothetical protein VCRA2110O182_10264 [Vibrio crassostreae]CAK1871205.1 hypothetical protein VCRA2113O326_10251 [Vibrio crassostreae]CAK1967201.1 hypothetical protein VCRA2110O113_20162 [Vibrio crassostreae]CAK1967791.1 hypothetical protein VCRA2114E122_20162 [Vibrio crassostreae]